MLLRRNTLSDSERHAAAEAAVKLFTNSPFFVNSQQIACYLAHGKEFDCSLLIKAIWQANKNCYLPVLSQEKSLEFVLYNENDPLDFNRYHILEPTKRKIIPVQTLELVVTPLVGFDLQGNRLGMGGGYYDRTFQFMREKNFQNPYLLGLAYAFQQVVKLPSDPWDVRLNGVLTEEKLLLF